jgi:uncharacterized SAM-binding protein YcdF (DUF218 family)
MDAWLFLMRKLVAAALLPPTGPLLLLAVGLLWSRRRRALGIAIAWFAGASLMLLSVPWVAGALMTAVGGVSDPIRPEELTTVQAIVILGGGLRPGAVEYGTDAPNNLTLERVRYGAFLAKATRLPVLVTGGPSADSRPEADVMAEMLELEYGVPVRWREDRARNTRENALFSAEILKASGVARVAVVSHAVDARRALREFRAAGIDPIAAPTQIPGTDLTLPWDLIPGMRALWGSYLALYELLGNIAAWAAGR